MYFFKNVCFLCLSNHKNLTHMLSVDNNGIVIEDKIKCCFPEIATFAPEVPKSLCFECNNKLHSMYEFKQSVLQNNTYFQDYINKLQINKCSTYQQLQIVVKDFRKSESQKFKQNEDIGSSNTVEEHLNSDRITEIIKVDCELEEMICDNVKYTLKSEIDIKEEPGPSFLEEEIKYSNSEELLSNLEINMQEDKTNPDPQNIESECSFRDMVSNEEDAYKTNIINNSLTFEILKHQCQICGNSFNTKSNLDSHLANHSELKQHRCNICFDTFNLKACLDAHQIVHSDLKKYQCNICGEKFRHSMTFLSHKRIHSGELFKCSVCGKKFSRKFDLDRHQLTHSTIKPYKCNICGKSYIRKDKLRIHMALH